MLVNTKLADCYQNLFNHLSSEHGLTLTISEMEEIVSLSEQTIILLQEYSENIGIRSKKMKLPKTPKDTPKDTPKQHATISDVFNSEELQVLNRYGKQIPADKQVKDLTVEDLFEIGRLLYMQYSIDNEITIMSAAMEAITNICRKKDLPIF